MKNGLYIVSTPIGNYKDITLHALEVLQNADYILCEDTRKTNNLLEKHNIARKNILIYNEHSPKQETEKFIAVAKNHSIALVSDAGTPLICDPGYEIVNIARKNNVEIFAITGACALIAAATICGINIQNMLFLGFFHKKIKFDTNYTNAFYLPPHDIPTLIHLLENQNFYIYFAREITKDFQEVLKFSSIDDAKKHFDINQPKGEFVCFLQFIKNKKNIDEEINKILSSLPNWHYINTKSFSKFLHENFLGDFSQKEIYNILQCKK